MIMWLWGKRNSPPPIEWKLGVGSPHDPAIPFTAIKPRTLCRPTRILAQPIFIADPLKIIMTLNHPGWSSTNDCKWKDITKHIVKFYSALRKNEIYRKIGGVKNIILNNPELERLFLHIHPHMCNFRFVGLICL